MSWLPSAVSATPALASRSSRLMVTITDAGIPPTEGWSADFSSLAQASSSASCRRCMCGRWSGIVDDGAVLIFDRRAAGFGQRVQDRVQLGTDGVAESACEMPHAVPPLLEFQISAVLLQLVIDGLRPVGVGGVDHGVGEPAQLRRRQDGGVVGEQLFGGLDRFRVEVVAGEVVHGPFHNGHFLRIHRTVALQCGQPRQHRVQILAEHRSTGPDGGGGTDPGRGVAGGELQHPHQELDHGRRAVLPGSRMASASAINW